MSINDRIALLVKEYGDGRYSRFAKKVGLAPTVIGSYMPKEDPTARTSEPSLTVINKILDALPEVSRDWLVSGEGPMVPMRVSSTQSNTNTSTSHGNTVSIGQQGEAELWKVKYEALQKHCESLEREITTLNRLLSVYEKQQ